MTEDGETDIGKSRRKSPSEEKRENIMGRNSKEKKYLGKEGRNIKRNHRGGKLKRRYKKKQGGNTEIRPIGEEEWLLKSGKILSTKARKSSREEKGESKLSSRGDQTGILQKCIDERTPTTDLS